MWEARSLRRALAFSSPTSGLLRNIVSGWREPAGSSARANREGISQKSRCGKRGPCDERLRSHLLHRDFCETSLAVGGNLPGVPQERTAKVYRRSPDVGSEVPATSACVLISSKPVSRY